MQHFENNNLIIFILYGALATVLIICAITDLWQRRIPNLLTYPTILAALTVYCFMEGWNGFSFSLGGLSFGVVVFLLPYLLGGMGAGDVKLMGAVGAVLGFQQTAFSFLFIVICGGILALAYMISRRSLKETLTKTLLGILYMAMHRNASLIKTDNKKIAQEGIPYGVAIAGGVFLFFLYLTMNNKSLSALRLL